LPFRGELLTPTIFIAFTPYWQQQNIRRADSRFAGMTDRVGGKQAAPSGALRKFPKDNFFQGIGLWF